VTENLDAALGEDSLALTQVFNCVQIDQRGIL